MILRAAETKSQQTEPTLFTLYRTLGTLCGGVSVEGDAGYQHLEAYSGSLSPESEQGMHSCPQDSVSCMLSCLVRPMTLEQAPYPP